MKTCYWNSDTIYQGRTKGDTNQQEINKKTFLLDPGSLRYILVNNFKVCGAQ